jgi:tetratricopeptide (TPR) repeat protein
MALETCRRLGCVLAFGLAVASGTTTLAAAASSLPPAAQAAAARGRSADKQQDYLAAIDHFQEARRIAPEAPEIYFYLGVEESRIPGRELRAIAWLGAYRSLRPDGPDAAKIDSQIARLQIAYRKTIGNMVRSVEDAARFAERKGPSLRDVARKLAASGDFPSALEVAARLSDLPESQGEAWAAIAGVQVAQWDIAGALKTTALIADAQPSKDDAWLNIVRFQVARDRAGALETIGRIRDARNKDRAQRIVSWFQARTDDIAGGLKTAESIQDVDIRASARNDIAHAQVDAGDLDGALRTAILIPATGDANAVLQHISMSQARKGDIDGALRTAALYGPDSDLPSRIARVQAESGDLAGALRTTASIENDRKDYATRSMVQASFALSQSKAGDTGGARQTLALARQSADLVADAGRREVVLRHIALIQAGSGDVAGALAVAGQIPSAYLKAQTQGEIVVAQAKAGNAAGALKTADVIQYPDDYIKNDALVRVVEIQAEDAHFAGALRTAGSIRSEYSKAAAQGIVAQRQVQRGDLAGAQATVDLIQDLTRHKEAQQVVDAARFKAGDRATLWRQRLEDSNLDHDGALDAAPFLDLPGHLQSLSATEDPKKLFAALYRAFMDMIDAEIVVNQLLEKQTRN